MGREVRLTASQGWSSRRESGRRRIEKAKACGTNINIICIIAKSERWEAIRWADFVCVTGTKARSNTAVRLVNE